MPCREHDYLLSVTTVITISFSCWAAFDLYAASHFRNRWSTMGAVRFAIVGTVIFWTIAYLPMIFFSGVVDNAYVFTADSYRKLNNYFSTPLVYTIGALTLIIIFTHTIENLRSQLIVLGISGIPFGLQDICIDLNFINNRIENSLGADFNGDGYIGGQGLESRLEQTTHIDFNGDSIIGRLPDTIPGGGYGGFPPPGYGAPGYY